MADSELQTAVEDGIVAAYLIRGGLKSERQKKCNDLAGQFYMIEVFESDNEDGLCLFRDHAKYTQLDMNMDMLQELVGAGQTNVKVVELDSPFRPDMMRYQMAYSSSGDEVLRIALHPAAKGSIISGLKDEAVRSLQYLFELERPRCGEIIWIPGPQNGSMENLPELPACLTRLTVRNMDRVFTNRVPLLGYCVNKAHWIHTFVWKFRYLTQLTLEDCTYVKSDIEHLKLWLPKLEIR